MFYVSSPYYGCKGDIGYRLVDFDTKEEQLVLRSEIIQRVESGESIVGVSKKDDNYIIQTKGKAGQISLEDFAILKDMQYLLDEFDYEKNHITPDKISYANSNKVWWRCSEGHSFNSVVASRTKIVVGCPYCSGNNVLAGFNDFETWCKENDRQDLLDEWDYERNEIKPSEVTYGSNRKVNWLCPSGHSYVLSVKSRRIATIGCCFCANDKVLQGFNDLETWCKSNDRQDLLDEWDYERNELKPSEIFPNHNKKVYWLCKEKSHSFESTPNHRVHERGCPYCHSQTSFPEQSILYYLRQTGLNIDNRFKFKSKYEMDIYLSEFKLGIEYDGAVWHSSDRNIDIDESKNKALSDAGIHLIRLREEGCPVIEKYGSEEIIVQDLDRAIKELFSLISSKYRVSINNDVNTKRDRQVILAEYRSSKQEQSIKVTYPQVASEWCYEKNGDLIPEMFTYGSHEKVWWQCRYCGHEWKTAISDRCKGRRGCPACRSERKGFHTNRTLYDDFPEIALFWSSKNPSMSKLLSGTSRVLKICCPDCCFEEEIKDIKLRIKRQNGLTCKRCGYHVDVQKWNKERDEYIKQQENTESLYDDFHSFLKERQQC